MDFLLMILVADFSVLCMMIGAICFSILILDKLGIFGDKGE